MMMYGIVLIKEILIGDLDNIEQINEEKVVGKQIYLYVKYIIWECIVIVRNRFVDQKGIYILEESYYIYLGKEIEVKLLFFFIEFYGEKSVLFYFM